VTDHENLKIEVLTHYGERKLACLKCGFSDIRALCLDHINGKGAEKRRQVNESGWHLHKWLKSHGYPKGYQTLCANCNLIKVFENDELLSSRRKRTFSL